MQDKKVVDEKKNDTKKFHNMHINKKNGVRMGNKENRVAK